MGKQEALEPEVPGLDPALFDMSAPGTVSEDTLPVIGIDWNKPEGVKAKKNEHIPVLDSRLDGIESDYYSSDEKVDADLDTINYFFRGANSEQRLNSMTEAHRQAIIDGTIDVPFLGGVRSVLSEWGAGVLALGSGIREAFNQEAILGELSEEDREAYIEMAQQIGMREGELGSATEVRTGFDQDTGVWKHVENPEEWSRINNLLYIGRKDVAKRAMAQTMDKYTWVPKDAKARQWKEDLQDWWLPNSIDWAVTAIPGAADTQAAKYEKGSTAYEVWDKLSDLLDIGQMAIAPALGTKTINLGKTVYSSAKVKKLELKLAALEKVAGYADSGVKKVKDKSNIATAEVIGASVGEAAETVANKLRDIRTVVKGFSPGILAVAKTHTGLKTKAAVDSGATLKDAELSIKHKEEVRKQITDAEEAEYGDSGEGFVKTLGKDLEKETKADQIALAKLDVELAKMEHRLITEGGTDAQQVKFYESLVEIEEKVRGRAKKKFERIPKDAALVDTSDLLLSVEAYMSDGIVAATKSQAMITKYQKMLDKTVRGMRNKNDKVHAPIMAIHDMVSDMKYQQRLLANSNDPNRGGMIQILSDLINQVQGKDGIFDSLTKKKDIKYRDQLLDAINFWKTDVVERFEVDPIYKIGKTDKYGKLALYKPEVINHLINEMEKGNMDVVSALEKAIGKDATSNHMAWKQLHQVLMDRFIRKVAPKGIIDLDKAKEYFKDTKKRRPFEYLPGMRNFMDDTLSRLEGIQKHKAALVATIENKKTMALFHGLDKQGMFNSPDQLVPVLLNDLDSARRAMKVARSTDSVEQLRNMAATYILKQARSKKSDHRLESFERNAAKIVEYLDNNTKNLNILMTPYHVKRLRKLYEAWDIENATSIPSIGTSHTKSQTTTGTAMAFAKQSLASIMSDIVAQQKMSVGKHWIVGKWGVKGYSWVTASLKASDVEFILRKAHYDSDALDILESIVTDKKMGTGEMQNLMKILEEQGHVSIVDIPTNNPMYNRIQVLLKNKAKHAGTVDEFGKEMDAIMAALYAQSAIQQSSEKGRTKDQGAL